MNRLPNEDVSIISIGTRRMVHSMDVLEGTKKYPPNAIPLRMKLNPI